MSERRRHDRHVPREHDPLSRVRLRAGREMTVRNVSSGGALVEGARLLPGTHVEVHVQTGVGRTLVRSRVVRCRVCALDGPAVRYEGAIAFDRPITLAEAG